MSTEPIYSSWGDFLDRTTERERLRWCSQKAATANRPKLVSGRPPRQVRANDVWKILEAAKGRCHWCGSLAVESRPSKPNGAPLPWEAVGRRIGSLEHVTPLAGPRWSDHGTNTADNLVWACLWCNTWEAERTWHAEDHGGFYHRDGGAGV